ncbi:oxygen-independent coproporphyrinogen III oxidase [Acidisoma sp. 7E03]
MMPQPAAPPDLIARYDGRVPRYTSYPTAPHFHPGIGAETYAEWLAALPEGQSVSLYLHVPFCERLCLYCGCNTAVMRREAPKRAYATQLMAEIETVTALIGRRVEVRQIHWGGGTPTAMPPDCLTTIMAHIRQRFAVAPDAEVAIEVDPTTLSEACLAAMRQMGVNRASVGVQDFDEGVQAAIGRQQSFEETAAAIAGLRRIGVGSINLDLIYGLPRQTEGSVIRTARQAIGLGAERAAVFGYAHVPWMKKHQALIPETSLPGATARLAQEAAIRQILEEEGGYLPVGLDHFALPQDSMARAMAEGQLRRGFQGYTTDTAPVLIGLGASAIGSLPQGYVQNATQPVAYAAALQKQWLATARGVALTADDRLRRQVIEAIMCGQSVDLVAEAAEMGMSPSPLLQDAGSLATFAADGLVEWDGRRLTITGRGRSFVRNVAALFDGYLKQPAESPRHARAL